MTGTYGLAALHCGDRYGNAKSMKFTHVIIGAGAVGLAIARRLADRKGTTTLLIERNARLGAETTGRNSAVIHAGIFYGRDSLKTQLCIKGREMLYELCRAHSIGYRNTKKWIVAQDIEQARELERIHDYAKSIAVPTRFLGKREAQTTEPDVRAQEAVLESPSTGIVDVSELISFMSADFLAKGGTIMTDSRVERLEADNAGQNGWSLEVKNILAEQQERPQGTNRSNALESPITIKAEAVINSAGLSAIDLSNRVLSPDRQIKAYYAKGSYFSYSHPFPRPRTLIYPAPKPTLAGLGTHLTMNMAGEIRFGPDVEWVSDPTDLSVNSSRLPAALEEIRTYLPGLVSDAVRPSYCGIRPKLGMGSAVARGDGDGFQDFIIRKEHGLEGFVNLLGIESPGLTSSLAIGEMVHDLLYR